MLRLILKENFFHFNGKHYLQNHGTAMGTKTAVLIPLPIFSWHILKQQIIEQASLHHLTTEFTTETFDTETAFLDTVVYKGTRFKEKSILDAKTHFKQTETSCTHTKIGFVRGEALRIQRKNSSEKNFEENNSNFKKCLMDRGYPQTLIENLLSEIKFTEKKYCHSWHNTNPQCLL